MQWLVEQFWPKGGWSRAFYYVGHRLRRLPDPPHRIARGIAAGVFTSFTPFFGFHFIISAVLAFVMQGNILAALMATFVGNPLTFPFIAAISLELGQWMLGRQDTVPLHRVFNAFGQASQELWHNAIAIITGAPTHWDQLARFGHDVFVPYLVGGIIPGVIFGVAFYMLALPAVKAYQGRRVKKLRERYEKRRAAMERARSQSGSAPGKTTTK